MVRNNLIGDRGDFEDLISKEDMLSVKGLKLWEMFTLL